MKKYAAEILPKPSDGIGLRYLSEFIVFSIYYENYEIVFTECIMKWCRFQEIIGAI
jgi:hypothetical protein